MSGESLDDRAEAVFRDAARPDRMWPIVIATVVLYVLGSTWGFVRAFGDTGREAQVQASPSLVVLALIVAVTVLARAGGRAEARAGGSPWRWPRRARRLITVLAVALPVFAFGIAPIAAIATVDAGSTEVPSLVTAIVGVHVTIR